MSADEWCPQSNRRAPDVAAIEIVFGGSGERFRECPGCDRRLRLTWNGDFYRHKRVLGAGSSVKSGEPQ